MRTIPVLALALSFFTGCTSPTEQPSSGGQPSSDSPPSGPITDFETAIPDAKLRQAMASAVGGGKEFGTITYEDLAQVKWLVGSGAGISDLEGVELCTNLEGMVMFWEDLSDLAPLAGMNSLRQLWLQGNSITSLAAVAGLSGLKVLVVADNPLDFEALKVLTKQNFPHLVGIGFGSTASPIGVAQCVELLKPFLDQLTALSLFRTGMGDAGFITLWDEVLSANAQGYEFLNFGDDDLTEASFPGKIATMTNLTFLYLWDNQITDVSDLVTLTQLSDVSFAENAITDLSPFQTILEAGGFQEDGWAEGLYLDISNNGMNLGPSTDNAAVIQALEAAGVTVEVAGNNTEDEVLVE